ncbi:hypothetical protein B0H16DRAFT_1735754 [Mycena metata]|uniref:Uncharacterized protein n=1 Tax=Mycena metata TaxID=1033252 RepID=A0AAD7HQZ3_9AGAR|nr:hypothetical protein B0H16DRAFT_1735754 [Mycena metata]
MPLDCLASVTNYELGVILRLETEEDAAAAIAWEHPQGIAQSYEVPVLTATATLSLGIVTMIESVRTNKKLCNQIADDIHLQHCEILRRE